MDKIRNKLFRRPTKSGRAGTKLLELMWLWSYRAEFGGPWQTGLEGEEGVKWHRAPERTYCVFTKKVITNY